MLPPQNMFLWHKDHLELKAIKTLQIQEKLFIPPSPLLKFVSERGPVPGRELL